jgi:hypothetical protein
MEFFSTNLTSVNPVERKKHMSGLFWKKRDRLRSPTAADPLNHIRVLQHIPVPTDSVP